jgi:hypothetical protein
VSSNSCGASDWGFLLFFPNRPHINSELPTFLINVAALETTRLGDFGDVVLVATQPGDERFPLESFDTIRRCAYSCG